VIGAVPREHSETRTAWRNGHRERLPTTQAGDLDLKIPKVWTGSFFPSLLERRRRIDRALFAVVMEAYVHGVSTRSVDDLVKALRADSGISKSEVSRICGELDEELVTFKERPLDHTVPLRLPGRTLPAHRPPPRQEEGPGRGRPVAAGGDGTCCPTRTPNSTTSAPTSTTPAWTPSDGNATTCAGSKPSASQSPSNPPHSQGPQSPAAQSAPRCALGPPRPRPRCPASAPPVAPATRPRSVFRRACAAPGGGTRSRPVPPS